jgi:RHS repeat-associated protein
MRSRYRLSPAAALLALVLPPSAALAQVVEYYHADGLGSIRVVTSAAGQTFERRDYLPFGEDWSPPANPQPRAFTGKERDGETGLDYFDARYYGSRIARFTSVDPVQVRAAFRDPQRWNRYSYARNNPLRFLDPTGEYVFEGDPLPEDVQEFKAALNAADQAARQNAGSERADIDNALSAFGREGDPSVVIRFGAPPGHGGETVRDPATGVFRVTLRSKQGVEALAGVVAHEGEHIRQGRIAAAEGRAATNDEDAAYRISAWVAKGLGWNELTFVVNGQDYTIWRRGRGIGGIDEEQLKRLIPASKLSNGSILLP